jgi:hypothetical protein
MKSRIGQSSVASRERPPGSRQDVAAAGPEALHPGPGGYLDWGTLRRHTAHHWALVTSSRGRDHSLRRHRANGCN